MSNITLGKFLGKFLYMIDDSDEKANTIILRNEFFKSLIEEFKDVEFSNKTNELYKKYITSKITDQDIRISRDFGGKEK